MNHPDVNDSPNGDPATAAQPSQTSVPAEAKSYIRCTRLAVKRSFESWTDDRRIGAQSGRSHPCSLA